MSISTITNHHQFRDIIVKIHIYIYILIYCFVYLFIDLSILLIITISIATIMVVVVIIIVILACPDTRCESGQTSGSCGTIITTTNAIITARRCVLPGDLQGRSRQFPACLFETSEREGSINMLGQFPLSRSNGTCCATYKKLLFWPQSVNI